MLIMGKHIAATVFCLSVAGAGLLLTSATASGTTHGNSASFSEVVSPDIPRKVNFAGTEIDLDRIDMYERLDRELSAMVYTHGNTMLTIKRANRYFPVIIPILKSCGVPADLVYLACIESNLNPRAYSPSKAAGFWQFLSATAKEYGLEVNEYVDERYHIEKATEAACRYLKTAYDKYGNWESAAAAYNGGMGRISRELEAQKVTTAHDLYLTDETSRYMFRLLAMKLIMENPARYGYRLTADNLYQPYAFEVVEVNTPVESWPDWAAEHGITYMTLRDFNPWIRAKELPNKQGKTYRIHIPAKNALSRSKTHNKTYNSHWVK